MDESLSKFMDLVIREDFPKEAPKLRRTSLDANIKSLENLVRRYVEYAILKKYKPVEAFRILLFLAMYKGMINNLFSLWKSYLEYKRDVTKDEISKILKEVRGDVECLYRDLNSRINYNLSKFERKVKKDLEKKLEEAKDDLFKVMLMLFSD